MDDLISRQAAIDSVRAGVLSTATLYGRTEEVETARKEIERTIKALPSVSTEKTGHWKIKRASIHPYGNDVACSECGFTMGSSFGYRYCPNCGAKMVEPQESEDIR